jgi:DNA-binding CsgD family transcriptional regulator
VSHFDGLYARAGSVLGPAQISEARDGPSAVINLVRHICADLPKPAGLLLENLAAVWLVRTALAAGDSELAVRIASAAASLADTNPEHPVLAAAAAHSLGLARRDPARLATAIASHRDPWARASAAEDLGVVYLRQEDREQAIHHLGEAVRGYQRIGAAADAARVRRRLRKLGVRRRHWTQSADRPVAGWESLTETERTTSELAAQGLNNRQIASQMYVSVNTVAFYLRHVFRKLGIRSRVELARIVIEQSSDDSRGSGHQGA